MSWPPEAFWLAVVVALPSLAVMVSGYRSSVVADLQKEIQSLKQEILRLRGDNEWLMEQHRNHFGSRRPRRPPPEEP